MTVNETIIQALKSLGYPVKPDLYTGKEKHYFTFNYANDRGEDFGDDEPQEAVASIQVHFFCPLSEDYLEIKEKIRDLLTDAGFTYPEITELNEPENKIRHLVYECEIEKERS